MFKKILIANRSEIAVRIIRACHEMNIEAVAVYSDADRNALHVRMADEAYYLGTPQPSESYLNMDRIIDIARACSADAVHPGYGFLAENTEFAKKIGDTGISFIGPSPESVKAMGDKIRARRLAKSAGVTIVPGTIDPLPDTSTAKRAADEIGYPVMIKAVSGGGGKGMRLVEGEKHLASAFERASSEALSAFGDGSLYMEKLIKDPRHIEFQILGDRYGNMVHLNERECSIQRKHQKLIEESPSPVMTPEKREKVGAMAVAAAKAAGYYNAGTIEFIMDGRGDLYFMEMNTRLQVEHPVTELVTGIDIVKEQIRIANGDRLTFKQADIGLSGSAIECRIVAEDPAFDFAPTPGRIMFLREPEGAGVRVDSGVYEGFEVPGWYDSLIAKLQTYGKNRQEAIARMQRALDEYRIIGISTTIPLYRWLLRHKRFIQGDMNTGFLDQEMIGFTDDAPQLWVMAAIAVSLSSMGNKGDSSVHIQGASPSKWKTTGRVSSLR
ncbi:MAG: acetyl-CoA carboxylase biotin carboxylase subunit [Deltaproteobacteria bacterium]|nr:acetyl-CoA carboxylase biotin carboxylase subunit [Deltaproteobacteria bacterium]MCL5276923.1 acetyl-CoA carboxylase biotin carboxylase subunit [Deltaproteobacteria bacterium]